MTQAGVWSGPGIIRHLDLILPKKDLMAGRPKAIGQEPDRWYNCKLMVAAVIQ